MHWSGGYKGPGRCEGGGDWQGWHLCELWKAGLVVLHNLGQGRVVEECVALHLREDSPHVRVEDALAILHLRVRDNST